MVFQQGVTDYLCRMNSSRLAHIALIISGILFGANYWIAKSLMPDYMNPVQIIIFRTAGATLLFALILPFTQKSRFQLKEWVLIFLCGILGVTINQFMFFTGLNLTTPVEAALLHTISPVIVLILAFFIIRERSTLIQFIGIIVGLGGAVWLTLHGKAISWSSDHLRGDIIIMVNITAYSAYLVLAKPLMTRHDPLRVVFWIFFAGMIAFIPFGFNEAMQMPQLQMPAEMWGALAYVVIGTTFLTYLLTVFGIKYLSSGTVGAYIYMQPVISGAIGIITGREILDWPKVLAAFLIFTGVFLVSFKKMKSISGNTARAIKKRIRS